jgi:hypothetical protein
MFEQSRVEPEWLNGFDTHKFRLKIFESGIKYDVVFRHNDRWHYERDRIVRALGQDLAKVLKPSAAAFKSSPDHHIRGIKRDRQDRVPLRLGAFGQVNQQLIERQRLRSSGVNGSLSFPVPSRWELSGA